MERLKLDLSQPFTWRIPWEIAAVAVIDSDGDLAHVYVRRGYDEATKWQLNDVTRIVGPPSSEWYIINRRAQVGKTLEFVAAAPGEIDMLPVTVVRNQKAHNLRTGVITVGTIAVQGDDIAAAPDRAIVLVADPANTGTVFVGRNENVDVNSGFPLGASTVLQLNVDNLNDIWFIADTAGQKVRYIVEVLH